MILGRLVAAPFPSTVLTFDPHPAEVLSPGTNPRLVTTVEERIELMRGVGVDSVGVLDLSEIRHLEPVSPSPFIDATFRLEFQGEQTAILHATDPDDTSAAAIEAALQQTKFLIIWRGLRRGPPLFSP